MKNDDKIYAIILIGLSATGTVFHWATWVHFLSPYWEVRISIIIFLAMILFFFKNWIRPISFYKI